MAAILHCYEILPRWAFSVSVHFCLYIGRNYTHLVVVTVLPLTLLMHTDVKEHNQSKVAVTESRFPVIQMIQVVHLK